MRVVEDNYFVASQAVAIAKGSATRLESLNRLLNEILATDTVKAAITNAGLRGVEAASPARR